MMVKKRIKVLFFLPGGVGGAERMTITVAKLLPTDEFDIKFVVIGRLRKIFDFIPKGFSVDCIPIHNIYCAATLRIWLKIFSEKPDLVYCSQAAYNPRVIVASKMAGVPVVIRSSGMVGTYNKSSFRQVRFTYKYADKIIAQQEDMRNEIIALLGVKSENVISLHNPLDVDNIISKAGAESPYPLANHINFCNVSRINRDKAQDVLIPAFAKVRNTINNAHLYFIGVYSENDNYYRMICQQVKDCKIEDNVHFIGYDSNPYRWVKHCDSFVFPSRREGLPNALIEASYLEKPCVAAKCLNIVSEIIKDGVNGYTVPVGDVDALADGMIKSLELSYCKMIYRAATSEDFVNLFRQVTKK